MHSRTLGQGLTVSAIGLGAMGMSQSYGPNPGSRNDMIAVLRSAVDEGVTFLAANQALVARVRQLAEAKGAASGQIALAWLLAQQPRIVPIPGTRRVARIQENNASTALPLSADEIADLDGLAAKIGVSGDRYNAEHMGYVDR
ncbi:aldo/keto reductase [Streptomyces sp. NPDC048508]|uniref:aldo/keto reductase n=1 Tax=Streptomyces sp. NPDC048508 TaxID=3365561 RepID=UPI003713A879